MRKLIARLRDALRLPDPYSPAAGFQRPRVTLKTGGAYIVRAKQGVVEAQRALAAATLREERFVALGAETPPPGMVRLLDMRTEERWTPVLRAIDADDENAVAALVAGGLPIAGYRVTQHLREAHCDCGPRTTYTSTHEGLVHVECGRPMRSRVQGEIAEHVMALNMQTNDDAIYSGYYPTIKGTDVAHHDPTKAGMAAFQGGDVIRAGRDASGKFTANGTPLIGGTEIRGGRAEYNRVLKSRGYEHFDNGYFRDVDRIRAEKQAARDAKFAIDQERADKQLPRKIGEI